MPTQIIGYATFFESLRFNKIVSDLTLQLVNFRSLEVQSIENSLIDSSKIQLKPGISDGVLEQLKHMEEHLNRTWNNFVSEMPEERFTRILLESYMSRAVDAYNKYLSDTIKAIALQHPTALSKKHQTDLAVFSAGDLDAAAEKIADTLSKSFGNAINYFRKNAGLRYDDKTSDFAKATEYVLVRNLNVHNGGIVNARFLTNTGRTDLTAGNPFPLTEDYLVDGTTAFVTAVQALDTAIIGALGLT